MAMTYERIPYNDAFSRRFEHQMMLPNEFMKQALETEKLKIANKYAPLETLIKAQNAQSYGSTKNSANKWLQGFNALPSAQKAIYLSDPDKKAYYDQMQEDNKQASTSRSYLTPELMSQYFPALANNISSQMSGGQQQPQPNQTNQFPQQFPILGQPSEGGINQQPQQQSSQPMQYNGSPNYAAASAAVTPENDQNPNDMPNVPGLNRGQQTGETHPSIREQPLSAGIKSLPIPDTRTNLQPAEKNELAFQVLANNKLADPKAVARADAATALHLMIMKPENREIFSDKINNALKFVGAKGKGQRAINSLLMEVPSAQVDYDFVLSELNPNNGNNVKMMEGLSSSDRQRDQLSNASDKAFTSLSYGKENAKQLINDYYKLLLQQGQANIDSVEGLHPGAREKLWGIDKLNGNYLLPEKNSSQMVNVRSPDGKIYQTTPGQAEKLLRDHPQFERMG